MARVPSTAALRTVLLALVLGLSGLAVWEIWLNRNGPAAEQLPSVRSTSERLLAPPAAGKRRVLVMGSSRVLAAVRPEWVEAEAALDVRNLGLIRGSGPLQLHVSKDFLRESDVVVVELLPVGAYQDQESSALAEYREHLDNTRGMKALDAEARKLIRRALPGTTSGTSPANELRLIVRERLSIRESEQWVFFPDGWQYATEEGGFRHAEDSGCANVNLREARPKRAQARDAVLERLLGDVHELDARGVTVFFIQPPTGGQTRKAEERMFPTAEYWGRLAAALPGRCWHFADYPETAVLSTCDGSHVTRDGAAVYSRWLGHQLRLTLAEGAP